MKYRIVITVSEPNPMFEQEVKEQRSQERWGQQPGSYPVAEREVKKLETVLTEAEFGAVRRAILEAM